MIMNETYTLNNGVRIPKLALGTWLISNEDVVSAVKDAICLGYRHIDTAQAYQNEEGVGRGIRQSGIRREDLFVTTKVAAENKDYDSVTKSIEESLKKLGLDYIDLLIIHSPQPWKEFHSEENRYFKENREVWRAMSDALHQGKVRAIGVSNFLKDDLDNILSMGGEKPSVNQMLAHIGNTPFDLIDYCRKNDILVEAYSPIAHGEGLRMPVITRMAEKYHVSPAQLCIRYDLQLGLLPLPKTANKDHMKSNAEVDFTISKEDMETLKNAAHLEDYGKDGFFPVFSKGI